MVSSEIRSYIVTRRKEFKVIHIKEEKNRKEAERLSRDYSPYGPNTVFHHIGISPGAESIRYDPGGVWAAPDVGPYGKSASLVSTKYSTEMTPKGMRVVTTLSNGEEYSTFLPNDEVEAAGLTSDKALEMLRGMKF